MIEIRYNTPVRSQAVLYIIVTFLLPFIVGQSGQGPPRNISCLSCHDKSPPFYGCVDRDPVTMDEIENDFTTLYNERGMDVVPECHMCVIQDVWDLDSKTFVGLRRKLCLVTNVTDKCTFDFPVGTNHVVQTCRCTTDLCNLGDITDIGGYDHVSKFPNKPEPPKTVTKSCGLMLRPVAVHSRLAFLAGAIQIFIII